MKNKENKNKKYEEECIYCNTKHDKRDMKSIQVGYMCEACWDNMVA